MSTQFRTVESQFADFLTSVSSVDLPILSPSRFAERMQLTIQSIAERAHVHRNTVNRVPPSPAVQDYMTNAIRVLRVAMDLNGDLNRSIIWFKTSPIPDYGYRTANDLVTAGKADAVVKYLESIMSGATG